MDTLHRINPTWKQYVVYDGKIHVPTIYSEAIKAIYVTVDESKFFYDDLSNFLIDEHDFKQNSYDRCMVNKTIKGKQATIVWYVDDLKLFHVNKNVVMSIINSLNNKYGTIMPLSIS